MIDVQGAEIVAGSGRLLYRDSVTATSKSLAVWYRCPPQFGPDTPIVIALHGSDRAAAYFRDCWAPHADRDGFLVIVPEFDHGAFPEGQAYNQGNVRASDGDGGGINPRHLWSYPILDRLFDDLHAALGSRQTRFTLFGHSAGGQFAHRYLALTGAPRVDLVVAANCGWYMAPETELPFPIGLGDLGLQDESLIRYLEQPLVLLLGDADTDKQGPGLARTPEAMAQGPHRLARGRNYYALCNEKAAQLGAAFNWGLVIVPGIAHDDRDIAAPAAKIIADHRAGRE